ncbi:MAG: NAD(P)-binding protein [Pyrinomonadaceae bacterium]
MSLEERVHVRLHDRRCRVCRKRAGRAAGSAGSGKRVLMVDRRSHIGGNAYDHYNSDGLLVHRYGPHIFHNLNSSRSLRLLITLHGVASLREHRVLASVDGQLGAGAD